jgi:hypothetical protein
MGLLKKSRKNAVYTKHTFEDVWCSVCRSEESRYTTRSDVEDYVCGLCIAYEVRRTELESTQMVETIKEERSSYPRGWHRRKKFVAGDGKVYERGKLVEAS